jgi:hypothetical protein
LFDKAAVAPNDSQNPLPGQAFPADAAALRPAFAMDRKKNIDILANAYILLFQRHAVTPAAYRGNKILNRANPRTENSYLETSTMKKIIAIAAVLAATQASAFWGNGWDNNYNNGYGYGNGYTNGVLDGYADGAAAGDFSMNMSGRANTNMRGYGNGYGYGDGWGRGYNYSAPYGYGAPYGYAPMAPAAPVAEAAAE